MFNAGKTGEAKKIFEMFLTSVLRQLAAQEGKEIIFDCSFPKIEGKPQDTLSNIDALAPNGIFDINNPVIFEFKYILKESALINVLKKVHREYKDHSVINKISLIFITYSDSSSDLISSMEKINSSFEGISVNIFDRAVIDEWITQFPIDYNNAISYYDEKIADQASGVQVGKLNFESKSNDNITVLCQEIKSNDCFGLVLGAGVSIDLGAKSWDDLLAHFESELKAAGTIDNVEQLCKKVGGSSLITAQLCKDLYKSENEYYWAIHNGLYGTKKAKSEYALDEIVKIIQMCSAKKRFRVLTYNFDNYLEQSLQDNGVKFNSLFNAQCVVNNDLSIYHVHGYLPRVKYKSYMQEKHKQSIYLTEENYNELYNHPYSWQISSQLSFFRENLCLFVGCSLTDPNIRRLLELTRSESRKHYAIMTKGTMSTHDLTIASRHFARLGVEIIWVDGYSQIPHVLKQLH